MEHDRKVLDCMPSVVSVVTGTQWRGLLLDDKRRELDG